MFSRRIAAEEMDRLLEALDARMLATTVRTGMFPLPGWVPRPKQRAGDRADAWLDDYLAGIIADRRAHPTGTTDVLRVLLDARYEDGTPLEDHKVRTEMLFLVIGGHETTAAGMAWTFALLAQHPEIAERVRAEVDALGGVPVGPQHLPQLELTRACFDEASRLQGSLVINPKVALEDDELGGYRIPKGATVLWSNVTLQRDPRFWGPDAERFRPDRWLDGSPTPAGAFQAFGRGPRMCLGKRLAYIEAVATVATAFQRYRFSAPPGWEIRHEYQMSMGVKGGVPLRLERR
jgi:cytochrome P450